MEMSEMTTAAGNFGYSADKRRGALQKRTESADREKQVQEKDQGRGQTSLRYCCVRETGGVGAWGWALKGSALYAPPVASWRTKQGDKP